VADYKILFDIRNQLVNISTNIRLLREPIAVTAGFYISKDGFVVNAQV